MKTTRIGRWVLGALVSGAAVAVLPAVSSAQAPPANQSPLAQARKAVQDANVAHTKSKTDLDNNRKRVEAAFAKENPSYAAAQRSYTKAETELKIATAAAQDKLTKNPDYQALMAATTAAKAKRDKLQADPKANPDEANAAFTDVVNDVTAQKKMETEAVDSDPKVIEAKQHMADAKQQLDDLKSKLDEACKADPQYAQAEQNELAAQQQLEQAKLSLQQTAKSEADAAAAAAKARAASSAAGSGRNSPPAAPGGGSYPRR